MDHRAYKRLDYNLDSNKNLLFFQPVVENPEFTLLYVTKKQIDWPEFMIHWFIYWTVKHLNIQHAILTCL